MAEFDEPAAACKAVLAEAYSLWLQFEVHTDDITMILAFIDTKEGPAPRAPSDLEKQQFDHSAEAAVQRNSQNPHGFAMLGLNLQELVTETALRPKKGGVAAKRSSLSIHAHGTIATAAEAEQALADDSAEAHPPEPKSAKELEKIAQAVRSNFLFRKVPAEKATEIFSAMRRRTFASGDVVFSQDEVGHAFYVLESGDFGVAVTRPGQDQPEDIFTYEQLHPHGANPCFGEVALMYPCKRPVTVTCVSPSGVLWEIDRAAFRKIMGHSSKDKLQRTLREVEVFRSLTVQQLDQLCSCLTEQTYSNGQVVITEGEMGDTFYIIAEGRARITRKVAPPVEKPAYRGAPLEKASPVEEAEDEEEQLLVEIGVGEYFGELALLQHEARAATVTATGDEPLKVLCVSKEAFEEVLGTLQSIITDYSQWRHRVAAAKELVKNGAGVGRCNINDFLFEGVCVQEHPFQYALASLGARGFTIKAASKRRLDTSNLRERVQHEVALLDIVTMHKRFCPLPLTTIEDDAYIYQVLPTRVSLSLAALLEIKKGTLSEPSALFYTACAAMGIHHLHVAHASYAGGILYRNFSPDSLVLDQYGYLQLVDYRNATKADPPPKDYCGYAHYFSPEQVRGFGHGWATDYWGLGCLLYELTTGSNPWLLGEDDSELAVYQRIESHTSDSLPFPEDIKLSAFVIKLLNELFEPTPAVRLGVREPAGFDEIKSHTAFEKTDWKGIADGTVAGPHRMLCAAHVEDLEKKAAEHGSEDDYGFKRAELLPEKPPPTTGKPNSVPSIKNIPAAGESPWSDLASFAEPLLSFKKYTNGDDDDSSRSFLTNIMGNLVDVRLCIERRHIAAPADSARGARP